MIKMNQAYLTSTEYDGKHAYLIEEVDLAKEGPHRPGVRITYSLNEVTKVVTEVKRPFDQVLHECTIWGAYLEGVRPEASGELGEGHAYKLQQALGHLRNLLKPDMPSSYYTQQHELAKAKLEGLLNTLK